MIGTAFTLVTATDYLVLAIAGVSVWVLAYSPNGPRWVSCVWATEKRTK